MHPIATCSTEAIQQTGGVFRLIPPGTFRAIDGRPAALPGWKLSRQAALTIVAAAAARSSDFVIDFEHQTQNSAANGQPAPAAGWFKKLEWREGHGLYVVDARWTAAAAGMIKMQQYRYISPVFAFDIKTGDVMSIVSAALTNNPALDGLTELASATRLATGTATPAAEDLAVAALAYQEERAASGVFVTTVQAVSHVTLSAIAPQRSCDNVSQAAQEIATAAVHLQQSLEATGAHITTVQAVLRITNPTRK